MEYKVGIIQHDKSQTGIDRAGGFEEALIAAATKDELNSYLKIENTKVTLKQTNLTNRQRNLSTTTLQASRASTTYAAICTSAAFT